MSRHFWTTKPMQKFKNNYFTNFSVHLGHLQIIYGKVASRSMSQLVAHPWVFRLHYEGEIWCLCTAGKGPKINSRPVYCSHLYSRLQNRSRFYKMNPKWNTQFWFTVSYRVICRHYIFFLLIFSPTQGFSMIKMNDASKSLF